MTEYEKGYKDGYEDCKKEISSNPQALFNLVPDMSNNLKSMIEQSKGTLPPAYWEMFNKTMRGDVTHEQLLTFLKERK